MSPFTALLLLSLPAAQEPDSTRLQVDGALQGGGMLQARVGSPLLGAPVWLAAGQGGSFDLLGPGQPLVGVNPLGGGQLFRGRIGADGHFAQMLTLPPGPLFPGRRVAWQAAVLHQGRFLVSPRVDLIGEPQGTSAWSNASAQLPAVMRTTATTHSRAGDLDRDGDLDLIILSEFGVHFLRNDAGTLVEDSAGRFPASLREASDLALADFDGDASLDLVLVGRMDAAGQPDDPWVLLNDGSGRFQAGPTLRSALDAASRVTVADVEGDGDADIFLSVGGQHSGGGGAAQTLALFRNQGGAQGGQPAGFQQDLVFAGDARFNHDDYTVTGLVVADVDRDGDLDLYVSKTGTWGGPNDLLLNGGDGVYTPAGAGQLPGDFDKSGAVITEDFNGDGYPDLFVCNSHWQISGGHSGDLLLNRGAVAPGSFVEASPLDFPDPDDGREIRNYAAAADIDGDGDRDLAILPHEMFGGQTLIGAPRLYLNQGGAQGGRLGSFEEDPAFWRPGTTFVAGGGMFLDLDGDGDPDFLASSVGGVISAQKVQDYLLVNQLF